MQKQEIFLLEGHWSTFLGKNIKVPFGIGHPHLHIKPSLYVCRRVQGSQIFKQNWIVSICSRLIVIFLIWVFSVLGGWSRWVGGYLGWTTIVYMSSGVFRGKESSNRIELSQLVQDLLNFGVLGSLQLWGGGRWMRGVWGIWGMGGVPTCTHMHAHACMHMYTCIEIANDHWHGGIHVYHV